MQLSVVVPTLNDREHLEGCLDALSMHVPDAEVIVVNGPSADGTTGMVRKRDDVAVLIELADRNLNAARNAGIGESSGDIVALLGHDLEIEETWPGAIESALEGGADVVSGPIHRTIRGGMTTEQRESTRIQGREVTYFTGVNVAFTRDAIQALDGFDEYLRTGAARDCAHRLAGLGMTVEWSGEMCVREEYESDGGVDDTDWSWKYRSLAYRLVKNYGLTPAIALRLLTHAVEEGTERTRLLKDGELTLSRYVGDGRRVAVNTPRGVFAALAARRRDPTPTRNPRGISSRTDRTVQRYDWR